MTTTTVPALIAASAADPLVRGTVERRPIGPRDVRIEIHWAGICHSDIHTVRGDWGPQHYPLTVGHEIAGIVSETGSEVTTHQVGDRVGVGCMVNSCGECTHCRAGEEQFCVQGSTLTYADSDVDGSITQGGYSTSIVVDEHFVLHIPDQIPLEKAAPLLCAGITTYSPLKQWGAGPGKRVAIVGLGGLGHLGVKFAHALGTEVTVLSRTLAKQEDGLKLGADRYYATSDPATSEELRGSFDLILNTVSAGINTDSYVDMLAPHGALIFVGGPSEPLSVQNALSLIGSNRVIAGSAIGGIHQTQEMLDFCAENGILPEVEFVTVDEVNQAWDRVVASDVRYRFVIDISSFVS